MPHRIQADENVERQVRQHLEQQGHDAVMVVDELAPGVDDTELVARAAATDRVVLTHDTDYFTHDHPTLFIEDETLPAQRISDIVTAISETVDQEELTEMGTLKVVDAWL